MMAPALYVRSSKGRMTSMMLLAIACAVILSVAQLSIEASAASSFLQTSSTPALHVTMRLRGGGAGQSNVKPKYTSNTKLSAEEVRAAARAPCANSFRCLFGAARGCVSSSKSCVCSRQNSSLMMFELPCQHRREVAWRRVAPHCSL